MLTRGTNGLLIVLSVLELCLVISSAVLGIKALCNSERRENEVESAKSYLTVEPIVYLGKVD